MSESIDQLKAEAWAVMAGPAWRNWTYEDLAEVGPGTLGWTMKERVDVTVAAVLRALAGPMAQNEDYACDYAERLVRWADEIEGKRGR